jgi:hypothetical protein
MATKYLIFDTSELSSVDFTQIQDDSSDTVRKSIDGLKCVCEYSTPMPNTISSLKTRSIGYTISEIQSVVAGPEWVQVAEYDGIDPL